MSPSPPISEAFRTWQGPGTARQVAFVLAASLVVGGGLLWLGGGGLILAVGAVGLASLVVLPRSVPAVLLLLAVTQPVVLRLLSPEHVLFPLAKRADEFALAGMLPAALAWAAYRRRFPLPRWVLPAAAAVAGLGVLGTLREGTSLWLAGLDAFLLFKGFVVYVVVRAFFTRRREAHWLVGLALGAGMVAALAGLVEMAASEWIRTLLPLEREGMRLGLTALISFFENEGQAAWFFAFTASATFAFYLVYRRGGLLALFGLFSLCAILTWRRKPLAGLVLVLAASVLLTRRDLSGRLRGALVGAGVLAAIVFAFGDMVAAVFDQAVALYLLGRDPGSVPRAAMYETALLIAWDYFPLGVGFGRFGGYVSAVHYSPVYFQYGLAKIWGLSPHYSRFIQDAFWPHVLGQFGFFGLGAFTAALAGLWAPAYARLRSARDPLVRAVCLAALLTFVEALVESAASPVFETSLSAFLLFGLAALAAVLPESATRDEGGISVSARP